MAMTLEPSVVAPRRERRTGGLIDAATVIDGARPALLSQVPLYRSFACTDIAARGVNVCTASPTKVFGEGTWVDGHLITLYAGEECKFIGAEYELAPARVQDGFDLSESYALEAAFMQVVVTDATPVATDITPGSGAETDIVAVFSMLESWLARNYHGVGTIHLPMILASYAVENYLIEKVGNRFYTKLGTKVSVGGGYDYGLAPDGDDPDAGNMWIYATGEVTIYRGEERLPTGFDLPNNTYRTLLERTYVMAFDCAAAAIEFELPDGIVLPVVTDLPRYPIDEASAGTIYPADPNITAQTDAEGTEMVTLGYAPPTAAAFTSGQYITVGTFNFYWNGTTWKAGIKP